MGGQACVFYGAAQVSKDVDLTLVAEPSNIEPLRCALRELAAERIAVPPFDPALFDRGHAIHFRCHAAGVEDLRVDLMSKLRLLGELRRTLGAAHHFCRRLGKRVQPPERAGPGALEEDRSQRGLARHRTTGQHTHPREPRRAQTGLD